MAIQLPLNNNALDSRVDLRLSYESPLMGNASEVQHGLCCK